MVAPLICSFPRLVWMPSLGSHGFVSADQKTYTSTLRPPGYAELYAEANMSRDYDTYRDRVRKLLRLLNDDATLIPLWGTAQPHVLDKSVQDTGLYTVTFEYWTPEKTWLSR